MAELGRRRAGRARGASGRQAAELGVSRLVAVGEQARPIQHGAALEGSWDGESSWVPDAEAAIELLRGELRGGDIVLVKASRSASLERVALAIADDVVPGRDAQRRGRERRRRRVKTILIAAVFALMTSILCTPLVVVYFRRRGFGQEIRIDGPQTHLVKRGTPTMGGVAIIGSTVVGYAVAHLIICGRAAAAGPNASGLLALFLMVGLGLVGFLDDLIKIRRQRSLGLRARAKFGGQLIVGVAFAVMALHVAEQVRPDARPRRTCPTSATSARSASVPSASSSSPT